MRFRSVADTLTEHLSLTETTKDHPMHASPAFTQPVYLVDAGDSPAEVMRRRGWVPLSDISLRTASHTVNREDTALLDTGTVR